MTTPDPFQTFFETVIDGSRFDYAAYLDAEIEAWRQRNLKQPPTYQRRQKTDKELEEWAKDRRNHDIYF